MADSTGKRFEIIFLRMAIRTFSPNILVFSGINRKKLGVMRREYDPIPTGRQGMALGTIIGKTGYFMVRLRRIGKILLMA